MAGPVKSQIRYPCHTASIRVQAPNSLSARCPSYRPCNGLPKSSWKGPGWHRPTGLTGVRSSFRGVQPRTGPGLLSAIGIVRLPTGTFRSAPKPKRILPDQRSVAQCTKLTMMGNLRCTCILTCLRKILSLFVRSEIGRRRVVPQDAGKRRSAGRDSQMGPEHPPLRRQGLRMTYAPASVRFTKTPRRSSAHIDWTTKPDFSRRAISRDSALWLRLTPAASSCTRNLPSGAQADALDEPVEHLELAHAQVVVLLQLTFQVGDDRGVPGGHLTPGRDHVGVDLGVGHRSTPDFLRRTIALSPDVCKRIICLCIECMCM